MVCERIHVGHVEGYPRPRRRNVGVLLREFTAGDVWVPG